MRPFLHCHGSRPASFLESFPQLWATVPENARSGEGAPRGLAAHHSPGLSDVAVHQRTQKPAGVAQFHRTDPASPGGDLLPGFWLGLRVQGVTPLVPHVLSPGPLCPSLSLRMFSCTQSQLVAWPGDSCHCFLLELSHWKEARPLFLRTGTSKPKGEERGAGSEGRALAQWSSSPLCRGSSLHSISP